MFDEGENRGNSSSLAQTGNKTRLIPNYILIERLQRPVFTELTLFCVFVCVLVRLVGVGEKGRKKFRSKEFLWVVHHSSVMTQLLLRKLLESIKSVM